MNLFHRVKASETTRQEYNKRLFPFSELDHVMIMANIFLGNVDEKREHSLTRKEKLEYFLWYVGRSWFPNKCG